MGKIRGLSVNEDTAAYRRDALQERMNGAIRNQMLHVLCASLVYWSECIVAN